MYSHVILNLFAFSKAVAKIRLKFDLDVTMGSQSCKKAVVFDLCQK